jgi:hypothetical protein
MAGKKQEVKNAREYDSLPAPSSLPLTRLQKGQPTITISNRDKEIGDFNHRRDLHGRCAYRATASDTLRSDEAPCELTANAKLT